MKLNLWHGKKLSICVKAASGGGTAADNNWQKESFSFVNQSYKLHNGKLKLCTHAAISAQSHQRGAQVNKFAHNRQQQ